MAKSPPEIPTITATGLSDVQESIARIVKKIEQVPFDKIGQDLRQALEKLNVTLEKADRLVAQLNNDVAPELKATITQARKTLESAEKTVAPDSPVQEDLRETLQEVTRMVSHDPHAVKSARHVTHLEKGELVADGDDAGKGFNTDETDETDKAIRR